MLGRHVLVRLLAVFATLRRNGGVALRPGIVITMLVVAAACSHRPVHLKFVERRCVKGTVEFNTWLCQATQPADAAETNNPCPAHMTPSPVSVCVVIDPKTGALTDTVVAKGEDPFDVDDDEAAAADKPHKHSFLAFWRRHEREHD
jgi:hypothetical protein